MPCAGGKTHSQAAYTAVLFSKGACPHTYSSGTGFRLEFLTEDIKLRNRFIGGQGTTGSRSHFANRIRRGCGYIFGTIRGYVSAGDFLKLLPLLLGDSVVGTTFSLADDLPYFGMLMDRDFGVFEYQNCMVDEWLLQSQAPELGSNEEPDMLYLSMNIICSGERTDTSWPGSPPALGTSGEYTAYTFQDSDGFATINGVARPISQFALQCKNFVYAKYVNGLQPHSLRPRDRYIGYKCIVPWNDDHDDLYSLSDAGVTGGLKFVYGTVSTDFQFTNMKVNTESPAATRHKSEVYLELESIIAATSAGNELVVVNDSTV